MKNWIKSFAVAAAATGALLSGVSTASAQAQTASLTVVIDKIELLTNGDAVPVTVYQPSAGIAATATTTIDLFNASQKLGVRLPISSPAAGTYNTMLVTFSTLAVGNGTGTRNLVTDLQAARQIGTDLQGRGVLVFGDCGTATTGVCGDLRPGAAGADIQSAGSIQPIVSTGLNTAINLPSLNFFLPRAQVEISGTTVTMSSNPLPVPVVSQAVDTTTRPNLTVGIRQSAFNQMTGGSATHVVRVGLWPCASALECASGGLSARPLVTTLATIVSSSAVTVNSPTNVTFVDVPDGAYFPMAWRDANNNQLLDEGEFTIAHAVSTVVPTSILNVISTTANATYTVTGTGATTISSTAENGGSGTGTTGGLGSSATDGFLGEAAGFAWGSRTISLTLAAASTVTETTDARFANNAQAGAAGIRGTASGSISGTVHTSASTALNNGSVTLAIQLPSSAITSLHNIGTATQPSRTASFAVKWAADAAANTTQIQNTETIHAVVVPATVTANSGMSFASIGANSGRIVVTNVPYVALTSLGATHTGEFIAALSGRIDNNGTSGAVRMARSGLISSTSAITVASGAADVTNTNAVAIPTIQNQP